MAQPLGRQPQSHRPHPNGGGGRWPYSVPVLDGASRPQIIKGSPSMFVGDDVHIVPAVLDRHFQGTGANAYKKAAVHHPRWGGDGGLRLRRELRHLRMALWNDRGFRPLRRAGISRRARRGSFARCDGRVFRWLRPAGISPAAAGDQRLCLWKPRFFEKNRVKLLIFSAVIG